MIVGLDVVNEGLTSNIGMSATCNQHLMQYFSEVEKQDLRKGNTKLTKSQREQDVSEERTVILSEFLKRALKTYT